MAEKSFFEVLKDEIRAEVRRELEAELAKPSGSDAPAKSGWQAGITQMHVWLDTQLDKKLGKNTNSTGVKDTSRARQSYGISPNCPKPSPVQVEPRIQARTPQATFAAEILSRFAGQRLPDVFTARELRAVWKKAALKTHPDRVAQADLATQARASALFRELSEAHELLEGLFDQAA